MKTRELTLNAMFIAVTVVMAIVPQFGIIQIGLISITVLHIPVIIAGLVLGYKSAIINALAFGVATLFVALTRGSGLLDPLFINPLVSVLPRLLFGVSIGLITGLMNKVSKNQVLNDATTAILSTAIHSVLVLGALFIATLGNATIQAAIAEIMKNPSLGVSGIFAFFLGILVSNTLFEIIVAVLIALPVTNVLRRLNRGNA